MLNKRHPLKRLRTFLAGGLQAGTPSLGFRLVAPIERAQARRGQSAFCKAYIGITGSVGKTTACYLTAELLATAGTTQLGVRANTERDILRLLRRLKAPVDFVVQEISGHHPGAIRRVTRAIHLDVAVVTNVGLDHLTNYLTNEAVAREKGNLAEDVGPGGIVCLNADNEHVRAMAARTKARVILFGRAADAEVRAENISSEWPERLNFDLIIGTTRRHVATRFVGTLMLVSVLAALSVVHGLGLDLDAAIARLAELDPLPQRLSALEIPGGHTYVLDTYKASMWSTMLLAEDLAHWGSMRRIFVLGDMSDTRNDPSRKYRQVLRVALKASDFVIGTGAAANSADRLGRSEPTERLTSARGIDEVRALLSAQPPSLVILKSNPSFDLAAALPPGTRLPEIIAARRTLGA